ncbi:hypothetical protein K2X05_09070 [bacterium]|nr:hypothetical protein [bacterium]
MKLKKSLVTIAIFILLALLYFIVMNTCLGGASFQAPQYAELAPTTSISESATVRPEVVDWIQKNFSSDPKKTKTLLLLADAYQHILWNPNAPSESQLKMNKAISCYHFVFGLSKIDEMRVDQALLSKVFDTKERAKAYFEWDRKIAGSLVTPPTIEKWEGFCDSP